MNAVTRVEADTGLPAMIDRAAAMLASAKTSAEILDAKETAGTIVDLARRAARVARAKKAHDDVLQRVYRAQADALEIEAGAKRRLADEYDAAQKRGEIASQGRPVNLSGGKVLPTAGDHGLSYKDIHEARQIRDAEEADPGAIRRALDEQLAAGTEPSRAELRKAVVEAATEALRGRGGSGKARKRGPGRNPNYVPPTPEKEAWQHLYGECRALQEWATLENIELALEGMRTEVIHEKFRGMNASAVRECANVLNHIMERINAETPSK